MVLRLLLYIASLAIVAGGVLVALTLHRTEARATVRVGPTPLGQLQTKLKQAQSERTSGKHSILSLDENELNALISSKMLASATPASPDTNDQKAKVRDFRVKLLNDRADVYLSWNFRGQQMSFDIEGKLQTVNGYIEFDPTSGSLGALPLPRSLLEAALKQATDSPEIHEKVRLPPNLTDLRVADSHVIATYK